MVHRDRDVFAPGSLYTKLWPDINKTQLTKILFFLENSINERRINNIYSVSVLFHLYDLEMLLAIT